MSDWPHAPLHWFSPNGLYMITGSTYRKTKIFNSPEKLTHLHDSLLIAAQGAGWELHAWAVFSNHYHFVGLAGESSEPPSRWLKQLHMQSAKDVNALDSSRGRRVWYQFWDTELTYEKSYLARLAYVHCNPVRHGLVTEPTQYRWGSARWFQQNARPAFYKTVMSMKIDTVNVLDEY